MAHQLTLYQSGLTSTSQVLLGPPPGCRWRVLIAGIAVIVGSGIGTRGVIMQIQFGQAPFSYNIATTSGTGSNDTVMGPTGTSAPTGVGWPPELTHDQNILLIPTLITGDTWEWALTVEEEFDA